VVVAAGAVFGASEALRGPQFVDRVTIENPTRFDVEVDVAGADGRVLGLSQVLAGRTKTIRDVIDQGKVWTFSFSHAGTDAASLEIDRAALDRNDWKVEIPPEVARRLEAAGYEPRPE
jgi:hypothetical protein